MTNEEFQNIVLEKFSHLDRRFDSVDSRLESLEKGQASMDKKLDAVFEQTADLTEFKTETKESLSNIKDTLRFVMYREIETEKEIFMLKEKR